jgi:hypothetical protein
MNRKTLECCGIKQYTDREVTANRPDIIIKNKKEKTCKLIDVAVPVDRNVVQKEADKKIKHTSLCTYIRYIHTTKVEHEEYYYYYHTGNNWSHRNSKKKLLKKLWKP